MFYKIFYWLFSVKVSLCNCHTEHKKSGFVVARKHYKVAQIGRLPISISETSGLLKLNGKETFLTHNDGGNVSEVFEVNRAGEVLANIKLPQLPNTDWEDITQDSLNNIYIADIGNNFNNRRNLRFFRFNLKNPQNVDTIGFYYPNQEAFPPPLVERNFDSEAAVFHQNKLFVFSKNRSPANRFVKMYAILPKKGIQKATLIDSVFIKSMVTGASISPNGSTLALLSYGKVFLFDISAGMGFHKSLECIKVGKAQAEAITFINNTDLVFTNEHRRQMFLISQKK